jgi:hypothetical protein
MKQSIEGAQAGIDLDKAKTDTEVAKAELTREQARHERIVADLEDEKIDIQAANTALGREKAIATREANAINREKNQIEKIKAEKEPAKPKGK